MTDDLPSDSHGGDMAQRDEEETFARVDRRD
jgi:hypothetical protein